MTDSGQTVEEHAEQEARSRRAAEERPQTPDASAPVDGGAPSAAAEDEVAGKPSDGPSTAPTGPQDDDAAVQAQDADEEALRGDVDELVAVAAQRDDYLALAQRTQADFENYRKRVARDAAAALERGMTDRKSTR